MHINTPVLASIGIDIGKEVFHIVALVRTARLPFVARSSALRCWRPSRSCHLVWSAWKPA